jgi:hypothetical protein
MTDPLKARIKREIGLAENWLDDNCLSRDKKAIDNWQQRWRSARANLAVLEIETTQREKPLGIESRTIDSLDGYVNGYNQALADVRAKIEGAMG